MGARLLARDRRRRRPPLPRLVGYRCSRTAAVRDTQLQALTAAGTSEAAITCLWAAV